MGSGSISWAARRQTCVATSTTEAEVHAMSEALKEAMHLRGLLDSIGMTGTSSLCSDSQSCLALSSKEDNSAKTKHYATRMAFIREEVKKGIIKLKFVATGDNPADLFTKGLGRLKTNLHRTSATRGFQH